MKKAIGYPLLILIMIVSWGIRIGLPIYGIYYIVTTFIDDGVIDGLISIPVVFIVVGIIEFILDFIMFPFALLVSFLLGQERPTEPGKGWFQRHLNWTVVMIWVLLLPLSIVIADIIGIPIDIIILVVPILIILPLTGWALKQKNRSLWWLLLFIIPFMWLVYLGLENRSHLAQFGRGATRPEIRTVTTPSVENGALFDSLITKQEEEEMPEEIVLEPKEIGSFLSVVASYTCYTADKDKTKAKDMHSQIEASVALGLLLAKQQPELVNACAEYWHYTRQLSPEDYVNTWLKMYQGFKDIQEEAE